MKPGCRQVIGVPVPGIVHDTARFLVAVRDGILVFLQFPFKLEGRDPARVILLVDDRSVLLGNQKAKATLIIDRIDHLMERIHIEIHTDHTEELAVY